MRDNEIFIIAEAGVNHNGNLNLAMELADAAKSAGVDAVKYQTFKPECLVSKYAEKADYQKNRTGNNQSQLSMIRELALDFQEFINLKKYCDEIGILFLSTAFDNDSVDFLDSLDMPIWKIPSGEITNMPYLIKIAETKKPVILSTGMSDIEEIKFAIDLLKEKGAPQITILHCNTEYPTPIEDANLRAINTLQDVFHLPIGYSDHTLGIEASLAAVALGATVIEKHFTLDKNAKGPDHMASLNPVELKAMVEGIRNIEKAMGTGIKNPSPSEAKNKNIARKSIVANRKVKAGEVFTEENLTVKRPGNGISPTKWYDILGQPAKRDFNEDELIEL